MKLVVDSLQVYSLYNEDATGFVRQRKYLLFFHSINQSMQPRFDVPAEMDDWLIDEHSNSQTETVQEPLADTSKG